jgi:hypothetical protein
MEIVHMAKVIILLACCSFEIFTPPAMAETPQIEMLPKDLDASFRKCYQSKTSFWLLCGSIERAAALGAG